VASALGLSVSAVSRLERGIRGLRVEQLLAWAGTLGYRVDLVMWEPVMPDEAWDPTTDPPPPVLDDETRAVLREVAAALRHMPGPSRQALLFEMQVWRNNALRQAGIEP
jgi:transcriptional regulator with XRE-family HTH domain